MSQTYSVQVLMPVYNAQPYLAEALQSICDQTMQDWQLLVIDDGSTDASLATIQSFAEKDDRIKWRSRENKGLVATLNELVAWSDAPYLARMDADDLSRPHRLATQLTSLKRCNLDVVGCWARVFGSKNETWHYRQFHDDIHITSVFGKSCMLIAALLCRREVLEEHRFDPNYTHLEEFDFISRIVAQNKYRLGSVRDVLYDYRQHGESIIYQQQAYREQRYAKRLYQHLTQLGIELSENEYQDYRLFIEGALVKESDVPRIGSVVEKVFEQLSQVRNDNNREFKYRWLVFCKRNARGDTARQYFDGFMPCHDMMFLNQNFSM